MSFLIEIFVEKIDSHEVVKTNTEKLFSLPSSPQW